MNRSRSMGFGMALLALTSFALPVVSVRAADDTDITAQVQGAKTAADHEQIAKYYDGEATVATQNAATHRKMADTYKGMAASSGGKGGGVSTMPQHCESIAKNFDGEAEHFKAMAQTHRDLAKTV